MKMESLAKKVLLIGWDAADWKVIDPLIEAGKMPHLKGLMDAGVWGNLSTLHPVLSPMLWTSIATGKRPYKHGIYGFSEPDAEGGGIRPITNLSRKTKAVWNILNQNGKKSNVVGWWPSHPAEPLNGVMVSDMYQKAKFAEGGKWPMAAGTVHPSHLSEHLGPVRIRPTELEASHLLPFVPNAAKVDQEKDQRLFSLAKIIAEISTVHAAATGIMQLEPWDFMGVYYDGIDHFGHAFMRYHPPKQEWVSQEDFDMYKGVVEGGYLFHDMMLGVLLKIAGSDCTIILMSDHGFHPDHLRPKDIPNEPAGPAAEHRQFGILVMKGPGIKRGEQVFGASVLDVAPTIQRLFGLAVGRDVDGKVLLNAFEEVPELAFIDSWDAVDGDAGTHPSGTKLDPVQAQEAINQLVALGYIEKPDENKETAVANTLRELKFNLAQAYIDGSCFAESIEILEELWSTWPEENRFGVRLLGVYLSIEDSVRARETFNLLVERKKKYSAEAAKELEKQLEAFKGTKPEDLKESDHRRIRKLRKSAGVNLHALAFLEGSVLNLEKRYKEALECLKRAEGVQMHNRPSLYQRIGEVYLNLRNWVEAEASFAQILEIDPVNSGARLGLCRSLLPQRRNLEAAAEALASIELVFHQPHAHYYYGVALHRLGMIGMAVKALRMAVSQNPNFPLAHQRLAYIYEKRLKNAKEAKVHKDLATEALERIKEFRASNWKLREDQSVADDFDEETPGMFEVLSSRDKLDTDPAEVITVVSGLPRSGTSLMMQMLDAAGIAPLTDGIRGADESNPRGYYEYEKVKELRKSNEWLQEARGKSLKVIAQLLPFLSTAFSYRIIFMLRDFDEIFSSQKAMLSRLDEAGAKISEAALAATFNKQIEQINKLVLGHPKTELITVDYRETVVNPAQTADALIDFLKRNSMDRGAMLASVEPKLYRRRVEEI